MDALAAVEARPDLAPEQRSRARAERIRSQSIMAGAHRLRGELAEARQLLEAASNELDGIAPRDAASFERVIANDVERQAAFLALQASDIAAADAAIGRYRRNAGYMFSFLEDSRGNTGALALQAANAIHAAAFEADLGAYYLDLLEEAPANDVAPLRLRAYQACRLSRDWLLQRASNGWIQGSGRHPLADYVARSIDLARMARDANEGEAYTVNVLEARAIACNPPDDMEYKLGLECERAEEMLQSPLALKHVVEREDARIREALDKLIGK